MTSHTLNPVPFMVYDPNREELGMFDEQIRMDTAQFGVNQLIKEVMFNTNRSARVTVTYEVFR